MKITAGLGSVDDYPAFAEAGADEVFCGYVPLEWMRKYGLSVPLNRREVVYYNVQLGSASELQILSDMREVYHVPVTIAINALFYLPEQYPFILKIIDECLGYGFDSFIIADPALLIYLKEHRGGRNFRIHISGEMGECNSEAVRCFSELGADRVIFHRKMTPEEMKTVSAAVPMEYEAFLLNEMCHFHGAFCNTLHCDELMHMCLVPYKLSGVPVTGKESEDNEAECIDAESEKYIVGASGCGLCALPALAAAGVDVLKIVGRGNSGEAMERDIRAAKHAVGLYEEIKRKTTENNPEAEYIKRMKAELFADGCSRNCYYRKRRSL